MTFQRVASAGFTTTVSVSQANAIDENLSNALDGYGEVPLSYSPTSAIQLSACHLDVTGAGSGVFVQDYIDFGAIGSINKTVDGFSVDGGMLYLHSAPLRHFDNASGMIHHGIMPVGALAPGSVWADCLYDTYTFLEPSPAGAVYVKLAAASGSSVGVSAVHGTSTMASTPGNSIRIATYGWTMGSMTVRNSLGSTIASFSSLGSEWAEFYYRSASADWIAVAWASSVTV